MTETYTTVEREATAEFEEKRSIFIGHAIPIKSADEAAEFIKAKKREFSDATHNVYAYILEGGRVAKYSDDGEPQGTAGMPVLDAIRKRGCTDVVVVVTRYFGGTLLGTGGLVHAYSTSAVGALNAAQVVVFDVYTELCVTCNYSDYQKILPLFSECGFREDKTDYGESVSVYGSILKSSAEGLVDSLIQATSARAEVKIISEKYSI